jgi:hypothetical protein
MLFSPLVEVAAAALQGTAVHLGLEGRCAARATGDCCIVRCAENDSAIAAAYDWLRSAKSDSPE